MHIPNAATQAQVTTYANGTPGGTGARIVIRGQYRL
jgi:hypothetical protein